MVCCLFLCTQYCAADNSTNKDENMMKTNSLQQAKSNHQSIQAVMHISTYISHVKSTYSEVISVWTPLAEHPASKCCSNNSQKCTVRWAVKQQYW